MSEKPGATEKNTELVEARGQLVKRLAVAGALVAVLLGVLALFDRWSNMSDEAEETTYTKPVPVQPKRQITQAVTPATLPEPTVIPSVIEPPPAPKVEAPPAPEPEAAPAVVAAPKSGSAAKVPVAAPAKPVDKRVYAPTAGIPESTAAPAISTEQVPADQATPSTRVVERTPSPAKRLFSGFLLQAGVFTSAQRAEELQAQLNLNGVPATLEARVQVGPFNTRQEAEAAQEKLRQMGVESLLVPPKGAKR
jgi:DedD protein